MQSDDSIDLSGNILLYHLNKNANFGETDSIVHDFSGNGNRGMATGTGINIGAVNSGIFNGGYVADASNDGGHINAGVSLDYNLATTSTDSFSFFTWFKKDSVCNAPDNTNEVMASRFGLDHTDDTWWIGCGHIGDASIANRLVLMVFPNNPDQYLLNSTNTINDGQWHHAGWVYNAADDSITLYLDGEVADSTTITSPDPITSSNPLCIGAYGSGCDTFEYAGALDEVTVFKRSLDVNEVKDLYERGIVSLGLSVRACSDATCSSEGFIAIGGQSPQPLALNGRYFQYEYDFNTSDTGYTPELYRTIIKYRALADIDGNGVVDGSDLATFTASYGFGSGHPSYNPLCDFNNDGIVDQSDLQTFAAQFGSI